MEAQALEKQIHYQPDIDKMYLYAKDPFEANYQLLINKRGITGLKHFNDFKAFIEYSNNMDDIYENIEEYNPKKKREILIGFDDNIADMLNNKKLNLIVTELFTRGGKLNIFFVFITQFYFAVPKNTKFYTLFHYENFKETRASTSRIQSFSRY